MRQFLPGLVVASVFLVAIIFPTKSVFAQLPTPPAQPAFPETEAVEEVDSFKMFWPLVAGKTVDDGFIYSLKKLKENLRGMLIFGKVEKADYSVFLATKRVLEAEKLINGNKHKLADKTLDDALTQLSAAEEKIQGFSATEKSGAKNKEMVGRASNIEKLAVLLASQESDSSGKLKEVVGRASSIAKKFQD